MSSLDPPKLSHADRLELMMKSGCSEGTVRRWMQGRARPASAKRLEAALEQMARDRAAKVVTPTPAAGPSPSA